MFESISYIDYSQSLNINLYKYNYKLIDSDFGSISIMFISLNTTDMVDTYNLIDDDFELPITFDHYIEAPIHTIAKLYKSQELPVGPNIIRYLVYVSKQHNQSVKSYIHNYDIAPSWNWLKFKHEFYNEYKQYLCLLD